MLLEIYFQFMNEKLETVYAIFLYKVTNYEILTMDIHITTKRVLFHDIIQIEIIPLFSLYSGSRLIGRRINGESMVYNFLICCAHWN